MCHSFPTQALEINFLEVAKSTGMPEFTTFWFPVLSAFNTKNPLTSAPEQCQSFRMSIIQVAVGQNVAELNWTKNGVMDKPVLFEHLS